VLLLNECLLLLISLSTQSDTPSYVGHVIRSLAQSEAPNNFKIAGGREDFMFYKLTHVNMGTKLGIFKGQPSYTQSGRHYEHISDCRSCKKVKLYPYLTKYYAKMTYPVLK
jgi:hypothetical protein